MNADESMTPLGKVLSELPVEPAFGRMILLGVIFRCLDPILIFAASTTTRELFVNPLDAKREAEEARIKFSQGSNSDHLASVNAFRVWRRIADMSGPEAAYVLRKARFYTRQQFETILQIGHQILESLADSRILRRRSNNGGRQGIMLKEFGGDGLNTYSQNMNW